MSQYRWQTALRWTALRCTLCATLALAPLTLVAQEEFSSANRNVGRAAVEYSDADAHIVAAYYYSQRNHESRWLMIEAGISTTESIVIERSAIALRTPQGRELPLATQKRGGEDVKRISQVLQNAGVLSHHVASYFAQRVGIDRHRVAVGPLFFESPTGAWEKGTYALIVRHSKGTAELPIHLE